MSVENEILTSLKAISSALRSIDESLKRIQDHKRRESEQFVKESKARMMKGRKLLNESLRQDSAKEKTQKFIDEVMKYSQGK